MSDVILIIDDDRAILEGLRINFEREGFTVLAARNGVEALEQFHAGRPDIAIIDVMLPDLSGFELLPRFKAESPSLPCLFLTARDEIHDKISGFSLGADDYVTKPFDVRELILRVRARLRSAAAAIPANISFCELVIAPAARMVTLSGVALELTKTEFDLIEYLAINAGVVLSRERIFEKLWGIEADFNSRSVDMHVSRLRRKIEQDSTGRRFIATVTGVGYMWCK